MTLGKDYAREDSASAMQSTAYSSGGSMLALISLFWIFDADEA